MSKSIFSATTLLAVLALSVACEPPGSDDPSGIQQLHADYVTAYNAGDADAIMDLWADNAVWAIPDEPDVTGAADIRAMYDNPFFGSATLTIKPGKVLAANGWGTAWGDWMLRWTDADGGEMSLPGTYAAWYKTSADGKWKMTRLQTSSVAPPVAPQSYAAAATGEVLLDNDHVIVQKIAFEAGGWVGEHPHAGNQLVITLQEASTTYRENGEERTEKLGKNAVMWIEATEAHDHKADRAGEFLLVTVK